MRVKDTVTEQDIIDAFDGKAIGIFEHLFENEIALKNMKAEMSVLYYTQRSSNKRISSFFKTVLDTPHSESYTRIIATILTSKFGDKWSRVYKSLVNTQYDVLEENHEYTQRIGTNEHKIDYNTTVEDNGNVNVEEITETEATKDSDVYGYNSDEGAKDYSDTNHNTETVRANKDNNTTHNQQTKTGQDTKTYDIDETVDISGRETNASDLIDKELNLRNKYNLFDIIFTDIDSILTLKIY